METTTDIFDKAIQFAYDHANKKTHEYKREYPELWELAKAKTRQQLIADADKEKFPRPDGQTFKQWRTKIREAIDSQMDSPHIDILIAHNVVKALQFMTTLK